MTDHEIMARLAARTTLQLTERDARIAELEATLKRRDVELAARGQYVERLKAKLAEYQESLHMSEGTRKLALKHRDAAEADAEALRECVMDLVNQHCFDREGDGILDSMGLSTNSEAFELLVQAGLAEYAREGYGRRQFIKLKNDPK